MTCKVMNNPSINLQQFKSQGISILEKLQECDLEQMILLANDAYYNEDPIMLDSEYDIVKEFIECKFPKNTIITTIGSPISTKNKVQLPFEMWSMNKIKPDTNALEHWQHKYKGSYIVSCKLDGVSGMYCKDANNQYKLYTRGNGKVGQDISHLIEPLHLCKPNIKQSFAIRGEFIISRRIFQEKYKDKFANPRNMVAGIINSQSWDERIYDLKFVAYEIIEPDMKPSQQLQTLQEWGLNIVVYMQNIQLSNNFLSTLLLDWRNNQEYEIDGIIVANDEIYPRISSNPEHAFAFKMVISDQMAEAKVVDVLWEASKTGYLKPRVRIEPIHLGGVRIEYATGFNGKFIQDNHIGIGALIRIIRSGDVIPFIQSIIQPAEIIKMPEQAYHWTDTHVDIILDDLSSDPIIVEKNITAFFVELGIDGLARGNCKRLIEAGYNSIAKIIQMTKIDFEKMGFKTLADKFILGISTKLKSATLVQIMTASGKFGRGISGKTIELIMTGEPTILTIQEPDAGMIAKLIKIKGIGSIVANAFTEHIREFLAFLKECKLEYKLEPVQQPSIIPIIVNNNHSLFGKKIVMTKVRDQEIIQKLTEYGAILVDIVNSDTCVLVVKSKEDTSAKITKALEKGIPIMTPDVFKNTYFTSTASK